MAKKEKLYLFSKTLVKKNKRLTYIVSSIFTYY